MVKNTISKIRLILMVLLVVSIVGTLSACKSCNNEEDPQEIEKEILFISNTKLEIERYEDGIIHALDESLAVDWSSSNNDVVTVDANGYYLAKSEGVAYITGSTEDNVVIA